MGDLNQLVFVEKHANGFPAPYLEIGSKDYGSTQDLRRLFTGKGAYVGVDLEAGPGVDLVLDLTAEFDEIDHRLEGRRFGTIFCLSVLEHCRQPFVMADHLTQLLSPGGRICISVPFAWKFHGYPSDYWRFTPEGIRQLFPRLVFDPQDTVAASSRDGEYGLANESIGRINIRSKPHWQAGRILRGISAKCLQTLAAVGMLRWIAGYPYVLAPTNVLMIGRLPG